MTQYLLYQYSGNSFKYIKNQYGLHKKLKIKSNKLVPISHQKAFLYSSKSKEELRKLIDKFNDKYNQRIRLS